MAKRFFDTELWDKEWFMELSQPHKLLFQFLFAKCDAAGIWSPNYALASAFVGSKVTKTDLEHFNKQIEILPDGKIFLMGFIEFQYGTLSENCAPHKKIIAILKKHNLFERVLKGYCKGIDTLKDIEEEKEEEKDKVKEKDKEEEKEKRDEKKKNDSDEFVIYPFPSVEFSDMWLRWKIYKKEQHKFTYKSASTEQAAINTLVELAKGHESTAKAIILQSISNGWKGFFELKQNTNENGKRTATTDREAHYNDVEKQLENHYRNS